MIKMLVRATLPIGLMLGTALWTSLAGCNKAQPEIQYVNAPAAQPAAIAVQPTVVIQDDYVYYPGYEVYYSSNRHQYVYRDGGAWVTRSTPPRVSVDVLFASPSIRMDFHDAPERHHENMMRSYPKTWAPDNDRREKDGRKNEKRDDRNGPGR